MTLSTVTRSLDRFIDGISNVQRQEYSPPESRRWLNRVCFTLGACSCALVGVALVISEKISPVALPIGIVFGVIRGAALSEKDNPGLFVFEDMLIESGVKASLVGALGVVAVIQRALPSAAAISVGTLGYATGRHIASFVKGSSIIEGSERVYQEEISSRNIVHIWLSRVCVLAGVALTIACRVSPIFLFLGLLTSCCEHACIVKNRWRELFFVRCCTSIVGSWVSRMSRVAQTILLMGSLAVTGKVS